MIAIRAFYQLQSKKIEHKIEQTVKLKEEVNTEKIDPLLDLDRESVNIPSFLRSRK